MTRTVRSVLGALVLGLATVFAGEQPQTLPPQTPLPQFRTGVDLLQLDVSVLDRNRKPVRGLSQSDFSVEIDGKPAAIVAFTPIALPPILPPAAPWMRDIAPDIATNTLTEEGRLVVVMFDHELNFDATPDARRIARAAVEAMAPGDLGAVIFGGRAVPQNFTTDRAQLLSTIEQPYQGWPEDSAPLSCYCHVCRLETITRVADALRDVPQRRKQLLYVGTVMRVQAAGECALPMKIAREALFRALDRSNLTVHSIDPSGLRTTQPSAEVRGAPLGRPTGVESARQLALGILPERTGGRTVINSNAPDTFVPAILAESESYYVLGVERPSARGGRRDEEIDIKVGRRGLRVSSRRSYTPSGAVPSSAVPLPQGGPPPSLLGALAPVWPVRDLPLGMAVAALAIPGTDKAAVLIVSDVRHGSGVATGPASRRMTVVAGSWNRNGDPVATHHQMVSIPSTLAPAGDELRYQLMSRLALERGRHEIRVAVEDATDGRLGSVYTTLDIPNFRREPLSLSGLIVGASPTSPLVPDNLFEDLLPIFPTALREFTRTSRVAAFVRAYQGGNGTLVDTTVRATLVGVATPPVVNEVAMLPAARFARDRSADYLIEIPVARLQPGPYLLTIEAAQADRRVTRHLRIDVRP